MGNRKKNKDLEKGNSILEYFQEIELKEKRKNKIIIKKVYVHAILMALENREFYSKHENSGYIDRYFCREIINKINKQLEKKSQSVGFIKHQTSFTRSFNLGLNVRIKLKLNEPELHMISIALWKALPYKGWKSQDQIEKYFMERAQKKVNNRINEMKTLE